MITSTYNVFILTLLIASRSAQRTYTFEAYVSQLPWSGTVDEIYFRLCNQQDTCGMFQSVPSGWQSIGETYLYKYTTNIDIGDIYKVEIVHPGSDMLCIGHIKVNHIEYDENEFNWIDWPHCIEESDGGGCDTVTIILPDNNWHSVLTIPCQYNRAELYKTYSPIQSPSQSPIQSPSQLPSQSPIPNPTIIPTVSPSNNPSISPTKYPSNAPSFAVTHTSMDIEADPALVNKNSHVNNMHINSVIIGGVIGGLIALVLCLVSIVLGLILCLRKRKKLDDSVMEVNDVKCISAQSTISSESVILEGRMSGKIGQTNGKLMGKYQKVKLMVSHSSEEESDEGLYDNERRNMTQRIQLDDNSDEENENENVVPKSQCEYY